MYDYAIMNGLVITSAWSGVANIAIKSGQIVALTTDDLLHQALDYYDAKGKIVLPALLDTHVHLREPGYTHKEDFYNGSCAAAAGGYGTIIAQPNTSPPAVDGPSVATLLELAGRQCVVDFGVSAQVTPDNIANLAELKQAGACILDVACCDVPEGWLVTKGGQFLQIFSSAAELGLPVAVYATDASIVTEHTERLMKEGRIDPLAWADSRSSLAEAAEVAKIGSIAQESKARVLFRQISSAVSLEYLQGYKQAADISVEINPHHLFLTTEDLTALGPLGKMAPPLRDAFEVAEFWKGLQGGIIDMIGGDHAPHTLEEKLAGKEDIWKAASGVPTLETALPLMLDAVSRGKLKMEKLVELMSEKPARWLGLYPKKGCIAVGSDADVTIVDPGEVWEVKNESLFTKCGWSPFAGMKLRGRVKKTMVRGRWVFDSGKITVQAGYGRIV